MMTDNRSNEQIVAEALREGVHVAGGGRSHLAAAAVTYALGKAGRLVAAQGAAPQAAKDIHEPNHDRVYCVRCGGNWPCQPAPVLPSSGVDEDKLAEVIESEIDKLRHETRLYPDIYKTQVARAVSAWLKGQGR